MNAWVLPGVLLAWAGACTWLSGHLAALLSGGVRRLPLQALLFAVLLPLLLLDEIIAHPQFEALCRQQSLAASSPPWPLHRTLVRVDPPAEAITGLAVPVRAYRSLYLDAATQQPWATELRLRAGGGKLVRLLAGSDEAGPLTFEGACLARAAGR